MDNSHDDEFDYFDPTLIDYPRFNELYHLILDCQELTRSTGEPHCVAIEGDPGVGKTRLIKAFVEASLSRGDPGQRKPSAIHVKTPEIKSEGAIATAILEQLNDPFPDRGKVWSQKLRVKRFIGRLDVDTVCFDDFHHLWDRKHDEPLYEMSDYIKTLIKDTHKTLVVIGITGEVTRILEANEQLARLFCPPETLEPFQWDQEHARDFAKFIELAEQQVGLSLMSAHSRVDLLGKLHIGTKGVVAYIFRLLRWSALLARREQAEGITMQHLSKAYETRLSHLIKADNPFL